MEGIPSKILCRATLKVDTDIQSNHVNTDTKRSKVSVFKRVTFLKPGKHLLLEQSSKEMEEDISIFNICNLYNAGVRGKIHGNTLKSRSPIYSLIKTVLCIIRLMLKQSEIDVYKSSNLVFCSTGNIDTLSTGGLFYLQKGKVASLEHTVDNKVTALARLTFYENLLVGRKRGSLSELTDVLTGFILRKCKGFSQRQSKLSVITRCPY